MPTYSTRVSVRQKEQLTAEEASDRHYINKLRLEADLLDSRDYLDEFVGRPEYVRTSRLEGRLESRLEGRLEGRYLSPNQRADDWSRDPSDGRRGYQNRLDNLSLGPRDREQLERLERFERLDRPLDGLGHGDRERLGRFERLDQERLDRLNRLEKVERERERERIERFREPELKERERPRSRERFDRDRIPDRGRDRDQLDRDRFDRDHRDRDWDRNRDRGDHGDRDRNRDRDWSERDREKERDRLDNPKDRIQDRSRERERNQQGADRPPPVAKGLDPEKLRDEKRHDVSGAPKGDEAEKEQKEEEGGPRGEGMPQSGQEEEEKAPTAGDQIEAMSVDEDRNGQRSVNFEGRDAPLPGAAKNKRTERLNEEPEAEQGAQGDNNDNDNDNDDGSHLRGRDMLELLRLRPEERLARTLKEVLPHVSEGLLGRDLSSAILKLLPATKLMNPVIPFGVEQELEKVFVDELVARFPSHNRQRGVSPPRSITADSDWQQRTLLALRGPEELEAMVP